MYGLSSYVDDALILIDPHVKTLWTIKVILQDFKLASSQRIHFSQSSMIGVDVDFVFSNYVNDFLHFRFEILPFK